MPLKLLSILAAAMLSMYSRPGLADYCTDRPNKVIVHTSQKIYFTTDTLCQDWSMLSANWSDETKNRAFSLLMTAIAQNKPVEFYFPTACVRQAVYAEPHLLSIGR